MKIEADKSIIWNEAAKAGLWLGLFTGAIILVNALFTSGCSDFSCSNLP